VKLLKVLHIWNTAGVGSIIARHMDKTFGTQSWVITIGRSDKFGLTTYGECWDCGAKIFTLKALLISIRYDLLHIHSFDRMVPLLKIVYPKKPVVLHYHGTDIRDRWSQRRRYWSKSDLVIVSTPDLLDGAPERVIYLPNPVDTKYFKPSGQRTIGTALYFIKHHRREDVHWPREVAAHHHLELTISEREIPYSKLCEFLNEFEFYIDRKYIESLSKTALEALACGLKVIAWNEKVVEGLPEEHTPEKVVEKLWNLYRVLCRSQH